jgi:hypothetical protein
VCVLRLEFPHMCVTATSNVNACQRLLCGRAESVGFCVGVAMLSKIIVILFKKNVDLSGIGAREESASGVPLYLPDGRAVSFESSFGWHNVDLRTPMPTQAELVRLTEHPIGFRDGKRVYLCTAGAAMRYGIVENTHAFSEHYDTRLYICQRA